MTPERWAQISDVFQEALDKSPGERERYLAEACGTDEALRRNVELMLAGAEDSLASPLAQLSQERRELASGEMVGPYRVDARIGQGGMGTVYQVWDTRLHRKAALKVLTLDSGFGKEGADRILREARAASSLNHPNIVTIYEVGSEGGVDYLVMEFISGLRLDTLLRPQGLLLEQAVRYAVQAADGLARAHAAGILHRDLKPSNMMVTEDDRIKILDFGLARVVAVAVEQGGEVWETSGESNIAGTAWYMSPEQAAGAKLDVRSDVFSFGSVLYELTTGRKPFPGQTWAEVSRGIACTAPRPPRELVKMPQQLERVILRCLEKDPAARFANMAAVKEALQQAMLQKRTSRRGALWVVGGAAVAGIGAVLVTRRPPAERPGQTVKFTLLPDQLRRGNASDIDAEVSVSPNGKHITYVEASGQLWVRDLDSERARMVDGATRVYQVFWSPDSREVGYAVGRDLVRIPIAGGTPQRITQMEGRFRRAFWSADGKTIVYCDDHGLYTIPANGGTPARVIAHTHIEHPSLLQLPGGRRAFLFQAVYTGGHAIYAQVEGENRRRLIRESRSTNPYPAYSSSGHIVYVDGRSEESSIWALPFSLEKLEATGEPFRIAERGTSPQVSANGTLVYSDVPDTKMQLLVRDRKGRTLARIAEPMASGWARLSPDARRIALDIHGDLWVYNISDGKRVRLTAGSTGVRGGAWTSGGDAIVYSAAIEGGGPDIFEIAANGTGKRRKLVGTAAAEFAPEWSRDGRSLLYELAADGKRGVVWRARREDGSVGEARPLPGDAGENGAPQFSPDGRYIVYVSNATGRWEVWVREFPQGKTWQVSQGGGIAPAWRRGEIFYAAGRAVMAVKVRMGAELSFGKPEKAAEINALVRLFDVSADGEKILLWEKPGPDKPLAIHVVHNWFEEFRAK